MKWPLIYLLFISIASPCGKGYVDMEQPLVTITSPETTGQYRVNEPVPLKVTITDNAVLKEVEWQVIRDINGQMGSYVMKKKEATSGRIFHINESFTPGLAGTYFILILATDGTNNISEEKKVTVQ